MNFFHVIFTRPFGIMLLWLYNLVGNYGLTLILFTIVFRLILFPLQLKGKRSTLNMTKLQTQVDAIKKKHKADPRQANVEISALYKKENVSMMGGCLPVLATMPFMIALYYAINRPLTFMMGLSDDMILQVADQLGFVIKSMLTDQIPLANLIAHNLDQVQNISPLIVPIDFTFLGLDLASKPQLAVPSILWIIPILSGATAYLSTLVTKKFTPGAADGKQNSTMNSMTLMMPLFSLYIAFILPAGVGLYWIVGNIMIIVQEVVLHNHLEKETRAKGGR